MAAVCSTTMTPKLTPLAQPFPWPFKTHHLSGSPKGKKLQRFRFSANLGLMLLVLSIYSFLIENDLISYIRFYRNEKFISLLIGGGDGETKKGGKKKFITKDEEPEQYWQTAGERDGENPMRTPLPYIIIFGMSTPFVILAIAFANGWIKVPVR
ncbi:hypothetical protein F511_05460 [Dorcoceras hygrometricum]|uniref:Transmembrane protein n=1 Tax=Dorcoceras hygrometricum TaxID=472368 RepID=A0A2Z7BHE9_9LAMI|nr:hypothetical protein F511_05460 [Dorcoceras hygrometricum]